MTFDGNTAHSCTDVKVTCIYMTLGNLFFVYLITLTPDNVTFDTAIDE